MSYHILIHRETFTEKSSTGSLYLNGDFFCFTLEDVSRGRGVKLMARTCIPEGTYLVDITHSQRFGREMPMIFNQPNGYQLKAGDIEFNGIRLHGGNRHVDTAGCPLIAFHRVTDDVIQGTAEKELTAKLIKLGRKGFITVANRI